MRLNPERFFQRRAPAFTLLEVLLAMGVLMLLVAGIFAIVDGTVQLTDEMTQTQNAEARVHGLHRMFERLFLNLPGDARVRFRSKQSSSRYLGQLAMSRAPHVFGLERVVGGGLTVLETQETRGGYLRLVMRWFTDEQAANWERGADDGKSAALVLLDDISTMEWRFYNPESQEWEPLWNEHLSFAGSSNEFPGLNITTSPTAPPGQQPQVPPQVIGGGEKRPSLVELNIAIGAGKPERHLFWVPPVLPPPNGRGLFPNGTAPMPVDPSAAPNVTAPPAKSAIIK